MGCSGSKHGDTTKGGRVGVAPGASRHAQSQSAIMFDSHEDGSGAGNGAGANSSGGGGGTSAASKTNGHAAGNSNASSSSRSLQSKGLPRTGSGAKLNGSRIVPPLSSTTTQSKFREGGSAVAPAPSGDELSTSPAAAQWMRGPRSSTGQRGKRGSTGAGLGAGAGAGGAAAMILGPHALDKTGAMSPASDGVMVGSGLGGKGRLHDLRNPLLKGSSAQNSKSAYFNRDGKPATPPGPGTGLLRRLPSDASKHAESRVMMALTSKKLAMQRQRRLQIKGESYRDVLLSIANNDRGNNTVTSPAGPASRKPPSASSRSSAKTQGQRELIINSLRSHFLMASVVGEDLDEVVAAMESMVVRAGTEVITQGDDGDRFYVIERGAFDVVVDGQKVATLEAGANFGELALMYNCPRAATVTAVSAGILWCLDRTTFRSIILRATNQALEDNRRWLKRVSLLSRLHPRQINKLADALQPVRFKAGDTVITQGETGDVFYLVKSGTVIVSQLIEEEALRTPAGMTSDNGDSGGPAAPAVVGSLSNEELVIMELGEGEHFGERALLTQERRAATVKAKTDAVLMALDRDSFEELLGPVEDVMEVTHSQRRLAAARVHLEREESIKSLKAAHAANSASTRATAARGRNSGGSEEAKEPTIRERKLRSDCVLANLRPVAVLGEGAFGVVQLVEHTKTKEMFALKQMQKARIVKTGQERNVCNEKKLLASTDHPFILKLVNAFKDQNCLYLVLEFLQGGDMFGHLYKQGGKFNTPTSVFYASTVLTVFEHLHAQHIVYRDLKPENLVLDSRGFLKVVDFGFAKEVRDRTYTLCGTPEYLAPELVQGKGHNKMVDYWALGILIYEMLQGYSPFADEEENNQLTVYKNIIRGDVVFSSRLRDKAGMDLVMALLVANPAQRLGSGRDGIKAIMGHAWFSGVQWKSLMRKRVLPPIIPQVSNKYDVSNFDEVNVEARNIVPYKDNGTGWDDEF